MMQNMFQVVKKTALARQIYDYTVLCPQLAAVATAGQFVHIRVPGHTLRRPISICEVDRAAGTIRLVFEIKGSGTEALAAFAVGDGLDILGPLGNGFELLGEGKKAVVIGGGIGTPPMLEVAKAYGGSATAILGFRDAAFAILEDDFASCCAQVHVTTDNGTKGKKGFVTDTLRELLAAEKPEIIYACGPTPMLKAVAELAAEYGVRCQVSLEERMACGVGACLVCACKVARESGEAYEHVCKDGPVFEAKEVVFGG